MRWTDTIDIDAPADIVWALTVDIESWPAYTPTMTSIRRLDPGPLRVRSRALVKQPRQRAAIWTVIDLAVGREFSWRSKRRALTMTGTHLLEPRAGGTRQTLSVHIEGPLSSLVGAAFGGLVRRSLQAENAGFKTEAERFASTA